MSYPPMYAQDGDTHPMNQKETMTVDFDHHNGTQAQFENRLQELLHLYGEVQVVKNGHHIDLIYKVGEQQ